MVKEEKHGADHKKNEYSLEVLQSLESEKHQFDIYERINDLLVNLMHQLLVIDHDAKKFDYNFTQLINHVTKYHERGYSNFSKDILDT